MKQFLTNMYNSLFLRAIILILGTFLLFDFGIFPLLNMANTFTNIIGVLLLSCYLYILYYLSKN